MASLETRKLNYDLESTMADLLKQWEVEYIKAHGEKVKFNDLRPFYVVEPDGTVRKNADWGDDDTVVYRDGVQHNPHRLIWHSPD